MDSVAASEDEGDVEAAWTDEITRRLDAHEQGASRVIPAEIVFAEAWSRVKISPRSDEARRLRGSNNGELDGPRIGEELASHPAVSPPSPPRVPCA
jgi:putative addiction module component (TIGR02574 family)